MMDTVKVRTVDGTQGFQGHWLKSIAVVSGTYSNQSNYMNMTNGSTLL
jgi:superfamily I DNA and/or RNA helicase